MSAKKTDITKKHAADSPVWITFVQGESKYFQLGYAFPLEKKFQPVDFHTNWPAKGLSQHFKVKKSFVDNQSFDFSNMQAS